MNTINVNILLNLKIIDFLEARISLLFFKMEGVLLWCLPGNWGSTSGYLSSVCKNGPLHAACVQAFRAMLTYIVTYSDTGVVFFFHVCVHAADLI